MSVMATPVNRGHVIVSSVLAGAQIMTGGAALADFLGINTAGMIVLLVAALQAGWTTYLQGVTTPTSSVAAVAMGDTIVAGPAASAADGTAVHIVDTSNEVTYPVDVLTPAPSTDVGSVAGTLHEPAPQVDSGASDEWEPGPAWPVDTSDAAGRHRI